MSDRVRYTVMHATGKSPPLFSHSRAMISEMALEKLSAPRSTIGGNRIRSTLFEPPCKPSLAQQDPDKVLTDFEENQSLLEQLSSESDSDN